jgi:hypothetical protein
MVEALSFWKLMGLYDPGTVNLCWARGLRGFMRLCAESRSLCKFCRHIRLGVLRIWISPFHFRLAAFSKVGLNRRPWLRHVLWLLSRNNPRSFLFNLTSFLFIKHVQLLFDSSFIPFFLQSPLLILVVLPRFLLFHLQFELSGVIQF